MTTIKEQKKIGSFQLLTIKNNSQIYKHYGIAINWQLISI